MPSHESTGPNNTNDYLPHCIPPQRFTHSLFLSFFVTDHPLFFFISHCHSPHSGLQEQITLNLCPCERAPSAEPGISACERLRDIRRSKMRNESRLIRWIGWTVSVTALFLLGFIIGEKSRNSHQAESEESKSNTDCLIITASYLYNRQ